MRILMLSQWFQPEPFFKGLPLAKALRDRGHDVEVLTGFPNYPEGKLYPGYRLRLFAREVVDGFRVNRVFLYPSHDLDGRRRMLNYMSFCVATMALGPILAARPDVIYAYNLITLVPAARLLRRLHGCGVVLDVQDLWPESVILSGLLKNRALIAALTRWCRIEYPRPDRLVVLSPGFKRELVARGVPESKVRVIYNWCDERTGFAPFVKETATRQDKASAQFKVLFAGTMGVMQGLDVVIDAARTLRDTAPDVMFILVGGGVEVARLRERARDLPNVQLLPRRPMSELAELFSSADAALVNLRDVPLSRVTIPSKVQAYMYAGKPILCGVKGDTAELVSRANAGIVFEPSDSQSLIRAVLAMRGMPDPLRKQMGQSGHAFYQKELAFAVGVQRLLEVLEDAFLVAKQRQLAS